MHLNGFRASKTEDWDESPQALYHELPLDSTKREIRVLDLLPGRSGDTLRAELRVISLDGNPAPSYEALSYTWGPAIQDRFLILHNAVKLPITDNLYDALQRLKRTVRKRTL